MDNITFTKEQIIYIFCDYHDDANLFEEWKQFATRLHADANVVFDDSEISKIERENENLRDRLPVLLDKVCETNDHRTIFRVLKKWLKDCESALKSEENDNLIEALDNILLIYSVWKRGKKADTAREKYMEFDLDLEYNSHNFK